MKTQVGFAHDLEDGWYVIKYDDSVKEFNHYKDVVDFIIENNLSPYEWVGDDYYNPEKNLSFKMVDDWRRADNGSKYSKVKYKLIDNTLMLLEEKYHLNLIIENPVDHFPNKIRIHGLNNKVINDFNLFNLSKSTQKSEFLASCDVVITIDDVSVTINKFRWDEPFALLCEIINHRKI